MDIQFIAGIGPIVADAEPSGRLYRDDLGLPLGADEYLSSDEIEGAKHFGVWVLSEASMACFGTDTWPSDRQVPQATIEFEVAARLRAITHGGQTVMSGSTWELVQDGLPSDVTVRDMGEHRLKDLTRPERVYQITAKGLDDNFPPLASLDVVRTNLPVQLTDFVDRQTELEDIKRIVGENRLVTILAPGGAGKTRLAIQVAADLSADYRDGVFFVNLAPVTSLQDVPQAVAEGIGVTLAGEDDLETQLLTHLASEHLLLVFDNLEHLIEAADVVSEILRAAPAVRVLATSRAKLNVTGETVFTLPGLEMTWDAPDDAFLASGVHLFIDAAKRADPSFTLSAHDLAPLGRILDMVGGMPLGILLAAAWVDALRIDEIEVEITNSIDFLESEKRDIPERHRSMRAVFDYSWKMLSDDDRSTFTLLSVFRGGFTRHAATDIAGASLRSLTKLAGKSLLVSDRQTGRYSAHELLRQYAEEELQADAKLHDQTVAAHTTFFADLSGRAFEDLFGAGDQKQALDSMEGDLDNIRSALRRALTASNALEARRFIISLAFLYESRGWVKAGYELFTKVGEAFEAASGDEHAEILHALALAYQAKLLTNLGHPDVGGPLAAEASSRLKAGSDTAAYLIVLEALSEISFYMGDIDRVLALSEEAIDLADEAGYEVWSAAMLNYQAYAYLQQGDVETALRLVEEGDEVLARHDEKLMRTWNLEVQATVALMQGRLGDAVDLRNLQVELARHMDFPRGIALSLQGLAGAHAAAGELDAANSAFVDSLVLFEQMGLVTDMASIMVLMARVYGAKGDAERAVEMLACVLGDPVVDQPLIAEQAPIGKVASEALEALEQQVDPVAFAAARAAGTVKTLEVGVKELLVDA